MKGLKIFIDKIFSFGIINFIKLLYSRVTAGNLIFIPLNVK